MTTLAKHLHWSGPPFLPARFSPPDVSIWHILGLCCLGFAWLFPGHRLPWATFQQETVAAVSLLLLAVSTFNRSSTVVWPRLAVLLCGVAMIPLIQRATGQIRYLDDAVLAASYVAIWGVSICVGASLAASPKRQHFIDGLAACLVLTGIASAGIALCQWLGPSVWNDWIETMPSKGGRPFANIGQSNHLSTLLLLALAGLLYWYEKQRIHGWCAALGAAWLGWGVVMTQSRTGWLAVGMLVVWWLLMRRRAGLRLPAIAVVTGVVLFAIAVRWQEALFVNWSGPMDWEGAVPLVRLDAGTRWTHWQTLWHALMQSPWFGYGWNQVGSAQFGAAALYPATGEWLTQSHNLVLDLLIYNGMPLGLLIAALLFAWFVRRVLQCRDSDSWCWLLALFVVFLHAMLENPLHYAYFLVPMGLLMGIVGGASGTSIRTAKLVLAIPTALVATLLLAIAVEYVHAEEALRDLRLASFNVGKPPAELQKPDWIILESWKAYHGALTMKIGHDMPASDVAALRDLASRYPYPNVLSLYAQAAAMNGQPEAAKAVLVHACKVHNIVVCNAMRTWWGRLGNKYSEVRELAFPASWI